MARKHHAPAVPRTSLRVAVQLVRSVQDTSGPRPGPLGPEGIPADALATLFGSAGDTDESAVCSRSFLRLSRCRCGRGEPSPGADVGGASPVGADVGGASPVALSGCRCGRRARRHLRFVLRAVRAAGALHSPAPDGTTGPTRCTHRRTVALRRGDHGGGGLAAMSIILRPDTGMLREYSRSLVSGDTGSHAMDGVLHARAHTLAHTRMLSNPRLHVCVLARGWLPPTRPR